VIRRWFDNNAAKAHIADASKTDIDWYRIVPFVGLHLGCFAIIWVGFSITALLVAIGLYLIRMFAITAFYHRYFSHKSFKTSRPLQFVFAVLGASATQRGPLWWAAHHRSHHRHSDTEADPHSPRQGFWWSHMGWFLSNAGFQADYDLVPDLKRYPELRLLDRFDVIVPLMLIGFLFGLGSLLAYLAPELNTSGAQLVVWGYFVSTVALTHATLSINSLAHVFGRRRYQTTDDSRNNLLLALLTLGEGWHNNHHHYPVSARQGFYWWEIDISYYALKMMAALGLIWDMKTVPKHKRDQVTALGAES
jgi:stearoyl-CoA desaturase (delta-9 desaturase)